MRLTPWRGPLHFFLLLATTSVSLLLPVVYGLLLLALAASLGWDAWVWSRQMADAAAFAWKDLLPLTTLAAGAVTWLFMLRPLLGGPERQEASLPLPAGSQTRLFSLVEEICWHLRIPPPEEIRMNAGIEIRCTVRGGLAGVMRGHGTRLEVGLSALGAVKAQEWPALLVRELAMATGGLGVILCHLLRELNLWFQTSLHRSDPWEQDLAGRKPEESTLRTLLRGITWAWMWAARLPFALLAVTSQIVSAAALFRLQQGADQAAQNVVGRADWLQLQVRLRRVKSLWEACGHEVSRGTLLKRLPENLPLLLARKIESEKFRSPATELLRPADMAARNRPPKGAFLIQGLPPDQPASILIRSFPDLSRQITCCHYQQTLGLVLRDHQLVADEEILHARRTEDGSLVKIRRYFGGLAHPERSICGLGGAPVAETGPEALRQAILQGREEIKVWGGRMKVALQEWNQAWQRLRDLEANELLSAAGLSMSRLQFGSEGGPPPSLRHEVARQRQLMEHMESALQGHEVKMERRFASALRLLWQVAPASLEDERLKAMQAELPRRAAAYQALAAALPDFRELLTLTFAFQALGSRHISAEDATASFHALQSVVPQMTRLTRLILERLGDTPCPASPPGRNRLLTESLLQGKLPAPVAISMDPGATADVKALTARMAADASGIISPFVDRFLKHYHETYAWLAETAEEAENHFIGPMDLGSVTEILLPEEFARNHEPPAPRRRPVAVPVPLR